MENNKIKVLYDANLILNDLDKSAGRSGIFFVAYNVLVEMLKRDDLNLELYCEPEYYYRLKEYIMSEPSLSSAKMSDNLSFIEKTLSNFEYKKYYNKINRESKITRVFIKLGIFVLRTLCKILKPELKNIDKKYSKYDAFFEPLHQPPTFVKHCKNMKLFGILYDTIPLIFPEFYPGVGEKNFWYNKIIDALDENAQYFSISEHTKYDFVKYVPRLKPEKIQVTHLAASEKFYKCEDIDKISKVKEKYNIPKKSKYIFSLCSLEPRKNLIFAAKNFVEFIKTNNIDDLYLVLGGAEWDNFIDKLNNTISDLDKYKDKIIKAGYVDDEDLAPLYSGAFSFIYPSLYEGFGLPPLEAMQCGCPVISSNAASLPEVVGDACLSIEPTNDEQLIEALEKMYSDEPLRKELSKKGMERAKEFYWAKTVAIMADKFFEVCNIVK